MFHVKIKYFLKKDNNIHILNSRENIYISHIDS